MSTPTMNHNSHMHQQEQQQQQQQQQQINEIQHAHLNSDSSPHATTLTRSDSTSTVILEEEETQTCRRNGPTTHPPYLTAKISTRLLSLLKTSGLFNKGLESSDKLNEFFASENGFALQRLLSEANCNDLNFDELFKSDSNKLLDARTLSEFLRSESFDQLVASVANNPDVLANPPAINPSSLSFSELRSVSPELATTNMYHPQSNQLKTETDNRLLYNQMDSFDLSIPVTNSPQFNYNQSALNAIKHDHAFLTKQNSIADAPSTSTTIPKRTNTRGSRRTSSRIQSRAARSTVHDNSKAKRAQNVSRAGDVKTSDDLNYYLERRRKNNEASKMSRAARKQKFGDMDQQCDEYARVNNELRMKITTLERVTASLKSGLVNNFQRKDGV